MARFLISNVQKMVRTVQLIPCNYCQDTYCATVVVQE